MQQYDDLTRERHERHARRLCAMVAFETHTGPAIESCLAKIADLGLHEIAKNPHHVRELASAALKLVREVRADLA